MTNRKSVFSYRRDSIGTRTNGKQYIILLKSNNSRFVVQPFVQARAYGPTTKVIDSLSFMVLYKT